MVFVSKVELKNILYEVGNTRILKDIDMKILGGQVTTIIGPNGCGKSTLLKSIVKLLPYKGEVYIDDIKIRDLKSKQMAKMVGILSQKNRLQYDVRVIDLLTYSRYAHLKRFEGLKQRDIDMIDWALKETGAIDFKNRMMSELSGGQQQRVWISFLLAQGTDTLLLDEPTTYLDIHHQLETLNIVHELNRKTGQTVVMVLHDLNQAIRYSDQIIVMQEGEIVTFGKPEDVLTNDVLNNVFNIDGRIEFDGVTGRPYLAAYDLFCNTIKDIHNE